ncbi:MAG: hypothetical protein QM757_46650 [Paludibaculum sp.]
MNTVEFAVENGIPYAIDFMNPAPDADRRSVGEDNFNWMVNAMADFAIKTALAPSPAAWTGSGAAGDFEVKAEVSRSLTSTSDF